MREKSIHTYTPLGCGPQLREALDEIGKNSVKPCTRPSTSAWNISNGYELPDTITSRMTSDGADARIGNHSRSAPTSTMSLRRR